jgi:dissimilatory sulfite reductase (desulfoviridin) alpha/beta subunit
MNKKDLKQIICTVPAEEVTRLKGLGCLWDKTTPDCFNVRVITRNGLISAAESQAIAEAAQAFGSGKMAMTTRLTIEIQTVPYEKIELLMQYLAKHDLETGGTGRKVRPIVSCKGTTCQYGLIDTFALSEAIHERFYKGYHQVVLPHKFKIGVGGCPNNCVKPDLNDLGIIGQRIISRDLGLCKGCKKCKIEVACPIKACGVRGGTLMVDAKQCNNCGRCMGKCPFHVTDEFQNGYAVYIGGRWGKKAARGQRLNKLFTSEEEVLDLVERCILFFREQGQTGERFADTVARIGFETVQAELLSDAILVRKEEILK